MKTNKKGFTLMELLIVVVMISGLVAIAYPSYISSIERARASEAVTMLGAIKAAQEKNYIMYDQYATTFREIRDFTPAVSTEAGELNHFNLNSSEFVSEYFLYTMNNGNATARRIIRNNNDYSLVNKGYDFTANYQEDFIRCNYNENSTEGRKTCSSLTDQEERDNDDHFYRIY
ncbi:MAG: prepilin-type N-terminal cleavage/methylation domain-containing protein [Elusimicrobiaceae bacterium]|nr:prepilin-type N-terminal cleavage/methylation domain-containing protein [Elusimicrobiaceae bacterium]